MNAPASPILKWLHKNKRCKIVTGTTILRDKGSWKYLNTIPSFYNGERTVLLKDVEDDPSYALS
jgi:hypothetical protein